MQINETQKHKIINFFENAVTLAIIGDDAFIILEEAIKEASFKNEDEDLIEAIKEALIDHVRENENNYRHRFSYDNSDDNKAEAKDYLADKDPSDYSLCLAEQLCYNLNNISAKTLARLHRMKKEIDLIRNFDFKELVDIIKNKQ